jgi:hypothetical protein
VNRVLNPATGRHQVVAYLARLSVRSSIEAGAWVGFCLGLLAGAIIGAAITWLAGAVLEWQRQLSYTIGVSQALLPFGDRRDSLQSVQDWWYLVIPATGIAVGLLVGVLGALVGGLLAVAYNKSPGQAQVIVEIPTLE